ncbi:DNA damage-binding protein CMR1 [Choanephora cucurbitarum]|uniref:DNA damage-binding protein CMR1 n=1 Tax=Choanephora cucurbitarum TaxID=101091 RepID=A0A1C7NHT4_9FUNG|nr:DNA damage-binding protein CMR1 [Choanephora cucurbitarum]
MSTVQLSEYERKRLDNIRENEALLRNLEIPQMNLKKSAPTASNLKKHIPKPKRKERQLPTRASNRLRGKNPDEEELKRGLAAVEADGLITKRQKLETLDVLNEKEHRELKNLMQDALAMPNTQPTVKQEPGLVIESDTALETRLANMKIEHEWATVKVTTSRITAAQFHPSDTKLLACAVDTEGYLGFWDVQGVQEDGDPVVYQYRPHTSNVTDLHFIPSDHSKIMTSSYDGRIRTFDMNKTEFAEDLDLEGEKYGITCFDISQDGHQVWFSTSDGQAVLKDKRANRLTEHQLREKKIGCIHLNPVHQHLMAAASNDRTMTIWDTRMLKDQTPLESVEHGYSVTSSYWSPQGNIIATASYDDYIRLFDLGDNQKSLALKSAIRHNNHTGRWVTNFRARWNTNKFNGLDYQHLIIGNMKHTTDIYSGVTGKEVARLYDSDHITAIPSVCQFHPTTANPTILTANAGGRVVCWTSPS